MAGDRRDDLRPDKPDTIVTSAANPTIKLARSLHRRRSRERERALLVEGVRSVEAAIAAGAPIRAILIDDARRNEIDPSLFDQLPSHARVIYVEHALFEQVTLTEHPQPPLAIAGTPDLPIAENPTLVLIVDGVRDPGNLGTIIRSAAAVDADAVILLPETADVTNPKTVRATAGALYAVPIRRFPSAARAVEALFPQQPIVAIADAAAPRTYDDINWREPAAIIIGGEAFGASEESRTYADLLVSIPIAPGVESLNAGVAASILLFEIARQRRASG